MTQTTIADLFAGQAPVPGPFEGSDRYTIAITLWRWNIYYNFIVVYLLSHRARVMGGSCEPTPQVTVPCTAECCTSNEPEKVTDPTVLLATRKLQGSKWRQFSPEWYKSNPWLVLCTTCLKAFARTADFAIEKECSLKKLEVGEMCFWPRALTTGKRQWKALLSMLSLIFTERLC